MQRTFSSILHSLGALVTSILSCATCPSCITLYAGFFSFIGIELCEYSMYFFPLMLLSISFTVGLMARKVIHQKANYQPLIVIVAASIIMIWSVLNGQEIMLYISLPFFMGSIFWHKFLLKKADHKGSCGHKCGSHSHS